MMKRINPFLLPWLISIVATSGSLYFSEVMHFVPCELCWYQRILMYPLVILFGFGFFTRDTNIFKYAYLQILIGNIMSFYHYGIQKLGFYHPMELCSTGIPCTGIYIDWAGFITIPFLSFVAFSLLHIYFWFHLYKSKKTSSC
jgi:disulfide bond formation protein DsbB